MGTLNLLHTEHDEARVRDVECRGVAGFEVFDVTFRRVNEGHGVEMAVVMLDKICDLSIHKKICLRNTRKNANKNLMFFSCLLAYFAVNYLAQIIV